MYSVTLDIVLHLYTNSVKHRLFTTGVLEMRKPLGCEML